MKVIGIANRQRLDVDLHTSDGQMLFIYTGIAVLDGSFVIDNILVHDTVEIFLGENGVINPDEGDNFAGNPYFMENGVVSASLASISDLGDSDNVTWAVDEAKLDTHFVDPATQYLKIVVNIAIQGEETSLLRISYQANILAKKERQ